MTLIDSEKFVTTFLINCAEDYRRILQQTILSYVAKYIVDIDDITRNTHKIQQIIGFLVNNDFLIYSADGIVSLFLELCCDCHQYNFGILFLLDLFTFGIETSKVCILYFICHMIDC